MYSNLCLDGKETLEMVLFAHVLTETDVNHGRARRVGLILVTLLRIRGRVCVAAVCELMVSETLFVCLSIKMKLELRSLDLESLIFVLVNDEQDEGLE